MTRGETWAANVRAAYDLNEAEDATVDIIAETMDTIDSLPAEAVSERRLQRVLELKALSQLGLPESAGTGVPVSASVKGRRAARARWAAEERVADAG